MEFIFFAILLLFSLLVSIPMAIGGLFLVAIFALLAIVFSVVPILYFIFYYVVPVILLLATVGFIISLSWQILIVIGIVILTFLLLLSIKRNDKKIEIKSDNDIREQYLLKVRELTKYYVEQRNKQDVNIRKKQKISSLEREIKVLKGFSRNSDN